MDSRHNLSTSDKGLLVLYSGMENGVPAWFSVFFVNYICTWSRSYGLCNLVWNTEFRITRAIIDTMTAQSFHKQEHLDI